MKNYLSLLASLSFIIAIGIAFADSSNKDSKSMQLKSFESIDVNKDGFIDRSEDASGWLFNREGAAVSDTNRDGRLSRQEYDAYAKSHSDRNSGNMGSGGSPSSSAN